MNNESNLTQQSISEKACDTLTYQYKFDQKLFSKKSQFQQIDIVENKDLGRILFNDSIAMLSEKDEFIYHDMIAHVPMSTHPNPKKVLIIGGGDGGTLREVLRHDCVESAIQVEIDSVVVEACKEFIPQCAISYEHPKAKLLIEDGAEYVKTTKEKFDVVIIDSTDPLGPSTPLFGPEFYQNVFSILNDDGICVAQAESPYYYEKEQVGLLKIQKEIFPQLYTYRYSNLVYPGGMWCLSLASKQYSPLDMDQIRDLNFSTKYYSKEMHAAAFVLPPFLKERFRELT